MCVSVYVYLSASADQGLSQRKGLEETLAACRHEVRTLEEKFGQAAQEIAKGNKINKEDRYSEKAKELRQSKLALLLILNRILNLCWVQCKWSLLALLVRNLR